MTDKVNFGAILSQQTSAITFETGRRLREIFPDRGIVESHTFYGAISRFINAGKCTSAPSPNEYSQVITSWDALDHQLVKTSRVGVFDLTWEGHEFKHVITSYLTSCGEDNIDWIVAETQELAERLLIAIETWDAEIRREVMVFQDGYWQKSEDLFEAIQGATLENLILPEALKGELVGDLERFLASRESYAKFKIPWKRGLLLVGPPGNGKTHAIKALVNHTGQSCLYVKSFRGSDGTETPRMIREVFERARTVAPCILVLEDLDSLIKDDNRSFFLNELDGFAKNEGIILISTTNHADRLDPAIVDRPSRFDRKYHFKLPAIAERKAFLKSWSERLDENMRLTSDDIQSIARSTKGFSFAYLRELMIGSMTRWIDPSNDLPLGSIARDGVAMLRAQMTT